jgi:thioredoxin 1
MAKRKNPNKKTRNSKTKGKKKNHHGANRQVKLVPDSPQGKPVQVSSKAIFEKFLDAPHPVVVDFWAPWCGPCKTMAPIFESVSKDFEGKVHFLKVNTQDLSDISGAFGIRSIPTVLALLGGDVVDSHVGLVGNKGLFNMAKRVHDKAEGVTLGSKIKRLFSRHQEEPEKNADEA